MAKALSPEQNIERVRAILSYPPTVSHAEVSLRTGYDREIIRRIRIGLKFSDVLKELPRMDPKQSSSRCCHCSQWDIGSDGRGKCSLGIPESKTDGQTWARGCAAFTFGGKKA